MVKNKGRHPSIGHGRSRDTLTDDDIRHRIEARRERSPYRHSSSSRQSGGSGKSGGSRGSRNSRYSYRADRDTRSRDRLSESQKKKSEPRPDQPDLSTSDAGPSTSSATSTATAATAPAKFGRIPKLDPSRKRSGEDQTREEPPQKQSRPEPKVRPELRRMPVVKRGHLKVLREELKKEREVEIPYDESDSMDYGFMFYKVVEDMVSFANPSGHVEIIKNWIPKHIQADLKDPFVIKVGSIKDKLLIEKVHNIRIKGHFDSKPLQLPVASLFDTELVLNPDEKDQTEYLKKKSIRAIRDKISNFWELMANFANHRDLSDEANLIPWVHLVMAKFSDLRGRSAGYQKALDDKQVAAKLDASPYFESGLDLPVAMSVNIPMGYYLVHSISKDTSLVTELDRQNKRYDLLHNDMLCRYPLCQSLDNVTSDCPMLTISCPICSHRGHDERDHEHHEQVTLDHLFLLFAPAHMTMSKIWLSDDVIEDDWSNSLRMEWTPKASAITGLPKPKPTPMSIILKRKLDADNVLRLAAIQAVADQEAAVAAKKKEVDEELQRLATLANEKMDVDGTSTNVVAIKTNKVAVTSDLTPEEEAELEQMERDAAEQRKAKRARFNLLKQQKEDQQKIDAAEAAKTKAREVSQKIETSKQKKLEAARIEVLASDVHQYIKDPVGQLKKVNKKKVIAKDKKEKIEINRLEISHLPFKSADSEDLEENFFNGSLDTNPTQSIVYTPSGLSSIGIGTNEETRPNEATTTDNTNLEENDDVTMEETVLT